MPDAEHHIRQAGLTFARHFAARDAAALVESYYVPDALGPIASPPGDGIVRGHAALAAMFEEQFAFASAITLTPLEILASGEMATELGRARLTLRDGSEAHGRYVAIWRNTDVGWRVKTDVFTLDG